ncbi:MAG TPA: polysaccharide deacetylase family protein [Blastocatellia bacterium]|nr:polysaccharide deacetylase family protein [Blastocatellia bacterium]
MTLRQVKIGAAKMAAATFALLTSHKKTTDRRVPVLCYHRVLPELAEGEKPVYTLTPEEFASQMAFLAAQGFRSLSFDEYAGFDQGRAEPPARAVLVTFDDGYADSYHFGWKIATHYGIKLNLLLCTGLIEGTTPSTYGELPPQAQAHREKYPHLWKPLDWSEIQQMAESGVGIGFHSHSHRNYGQITANEIAEDLAVGLNLLDLKLGVRPKAFAFPDGSASTYNPAVIFLMRSCGLELIFTTHLGRTLLGDNNNLFSRLVVYQGDDLEVFQRKLFGAYDWLGKARSIDQAMRAFWSRSIYR